MKQELKVGDEVFETIHGKRCKIIADKNIPHIASNTTIEIYPDDGYDFILVEANRINGVFYPYLQSKKEDLECINSPLQD